MKDSKKRKEIAPVLQGLKEYLDNHYMEEILQEIKAAMTLGQVEELDTDCRAGEKWTVPKEKHTGSRSSAVEKAAAWGRIKRFFSSAENGLQTV